MKCISRLTALLLSLLMLLSSAASAEDITSTDDTTLSDFELWYEAASTGECSTDNQYCLAIDELAAMKPAARYTYLCETFEGSDEGATFVAALQTHHYFYHYQQGKDTDLLCVCNQDDTLDFKGYPMAMYPYGGDIHIDDCPWSNTTLLANRLANDAEFAAWYELDTTTEAMVNRALVCDALNQLVLEEGEDGVLYLYVAREANPRATVDADGYVTDIKTGFTFARIVDGVFYALDDVPTTAQ